MTWAPRALGRCRWPNRRGRARVARSPRWAHGGLLCALLASPAAASTLVGPRPQDAPAARSILEDSGEPADRLLWFLEGAEGLHGGAVRVLGVESVQRCAGAADAQLPAALQAVLESGVEADPAAIAQVQGGPAALACAERFVSPRALFELHAALATLAGSEALEPVDAAVRIDPVGRLPVGPAEQLERAFVKRRQAAQAEAPVLVVAAAEGLRIDGNEPFEGSWSLLAGRHLLQVERDGRVEGAWIELRAAASVGDPEGLWSLAISGLDATPAGNVSAREPAGDAVRAALVALHGGEPVLPTDGRTFRLQESGRVRATPAARRWRVRPTLTVLGGWMAHHGSPCAPGSAIEADGGLPWSSCASHSSPRLLYPLPTNHWASIEVAGGLQAHVISARVGATLGIGRRTSPLHEGGSGTPLLSRIRLGVGVETPTSLVRGAVRLDGVVVPLGKQRGVASNGDETLLLDRDAAAWVGGGLAGALLVRLGRAPAWLRLEGSGGWAGNPFGNASAGVELRGL